MQKSDLWRDYELIDCGGGEKLERWGDVVLCRPDPQAIWPAAVPAKWENADAHYIRSASGGGQWEYQKTLPEKWTVGYEKYSFAVRPTGFKHTGLFPEQAINWDYIDAKLRGHAGMKVLNLFGYTGGSSVAAAAAGAEVCHVDAAKGIVSWAKENMALSGLENAPVRYIVDDAVKFVLREGRRGKQYDAIIMDPPSYGRGPDGEMWKIEEQLYGLIDSCMAILSDTPKFMIVNSYTTGLAPTVLYNLLSQTVQKRFGGKVMADEIGLPITASGLVLPCGCVGRWEA